MVTKKIEMNYSLHPEETGRGVSLMQDGKFRLDIRKRFLAEPWERSLERLWALHPWKFKGRFDGHLAGLV